MRADRPIVHMVRQSPGSAVWHFAREARTDNGSKLIHYGDCATAFFEVSDHRSFLLGAILPEPICKACLNVRRGRRVDGSQT